jgi:glycosyltransferase involved in cell wall biosynthesis
MATKELCIVHIGLLTPSFPPMVDGGVAIATGRLVQHLLRRGHRITVLTTAPPSPLACVPNRPDPAFATMRIHYGLVQEPLAAPDEVATLCRWAEAQHQQRPFDVFLAYFVYPSGYLATLVGAHLGVPAVCSCRGNDISKDLFIDPATLTTVLQRSTWLIFVSASLLHMADTLVPCRAKSTLVANAVDGTVFVPAASHQTQVETTVLGTSGLMRWKKGIDLFLPLVRDLCTTQDVHFLIAGYGLDAAVDAQITDFLTRHNLHQRVDILGPLPHEQMVYALQRMHLYVTTSYQEGMPNGVLEAMACALPVVATAADGIPQLVADGVTGFLCPLGDLAAVIARCRELIAQPALRRRMGQAGRQRVQEQFHPDREAQAVEAVLYQACKV